MKAKVKARTENGDKEVFKLVANPIKDYSWGCTDPKCLVATLSQNQHQHYQNFAELWMGKHPNGQSQVAPLVSHQIVQKNRTLGQFLIDRGLSFPDFLFKVLSIQKCLSIQVHPSKQQAQQLHQARPDVYLDPNDKPEMLYSLSEDFQCFLGYLSEQEFQRVLKEVCLTGYDKILAEKKNCKQAILHILSLPEKAQQQLYQGCLKNLLNIHPSRYSEESSLSLKKILEDFPQDIGVVISFFLEYKKLKRGSCWFISAGTPHAYIKGECLEIMKNSDNVCRLGLTPKLKDTQAMKEVLGEQGQSVQVKGVHNQQIHRFNEETYETELKVTNEEFSHDNLHLHHFSYVGSKVTNPDPIDKLENEINHPHSSQYLPIYSEHCQRLKFGLVIQGSFGVSRDDGPMLPLLQADVLILEPGSHYQLLVPRSVSQGLISLGWSSY